MHLASDTPSPRGLVAVPPAASAGLTLIGLLVFPPTGPTSAGLLVVSPAGSLVVLPTGPTSAGLALIGPVVVSPAASVGLTLIGPIVVSPAASVGLTLIGLLVVSPAASVGSFVFPPAASQPPGPTLAAPLVGSPVGPISS